MKQPLLTAFLLALPASTLAQTQVWNTRTTDQTLPHANLDAQLRGQVLTYFDGGTSEFRTDGQYFYTYGGGGTWEGRYVVGTDSSVCVTYVTGSTRCDLFVMANDRLTVITEEGLRFPIKQIATPE